MWKVLVDLIEKGERSPERGFFLDWSGHVWLSILSTLDLISACGILMQVQMSSDRLCGMVQLSFQHGLKSLCLVAAVQTN